MEKVYVIYWSQTGNTKAMANAVAEGVTAAGKEVVLLQPNEANIADFENLPGFAMGCPAMGDEVLEETEMEPFVASIEGKLSGKKIALFGSYGWGDGQWMRDWVERMKKVGATIISGDGVMANELPNDEALAECKALGSALATL